jgi:SHS2 domain-containing protein
MFRLLEHPADIGFEVEADKVETLFEEAVRALLQVAAEPVPVDEKTFEVFEVDGTDYADLLVNVLSEVLFRFDAGLMAVSAVSVESIAPTSARLELRGEPRDPARHPWRLIVKAVTYHGLEVAERDGSWRARVYLDI